MKIRIKGNTLRYRLSKNEVALLAENGMLEERIEFISGTLLYTIRQSNDENLSADLIQNTITLYVPQTALQQWANTELVGLNYNLPLPNGNMLYLLLEKDFKCIDMDVKEDQSDYFDNPKITC